jgi:pimeloyl-ACP methyl ester carboxylesterase
MQEGLVEAAGMQLYLRRWGAQGRPAVFYWHGGGGGSNEWPHFAPALEAAGYSVYAPEAPGYGGSPPIALEGYRNSAMADLALAVIGALGIAPVVWAGYSWGGNVGIHAVARAADRFRGLALLDGGYLLPEDDPSDDPSLDFEGRMEHWRAKLEQQDDVDEAPIEIVAAAMAGNNVEPGLPLLPEVEAAGLPVLLIASTKPPEYDELRARAHTRFRTAAPSAEIVSVDADHGIFTAAGEEVRRVLLDWLAEKGL